MNTDELIRQLLDHPETACRLPEARDPATVQAFLRHCLAEVAVRPSFGSHFVDVAGRIVSERCDLVQVLAISAISHRALGRPEEAFRVIEQSWAHIDDCVYCPPDVLKRRAFIKRDLTLFEEALEDASHSLERYQSLADPGHDFYGNGIASALLCRGQIHYEASCSALDQARRRQQLSASVDDISSSLAVTSPTASPRLYRVATFNLAVALAATGRRTDLLLADQHLRTARRLFKGVRKLSQHRARLDWLTAMLRYELGTMKLHRVREYLMRARQTFLELGLVFESVAVSADLARIAFPDRRGVWEVFNSHQIDTFIDRLNPEVRIALDHLETAMEARGWKAFETIKAAIEGVREACGPQVLACLVSWRQ